MGIIFTVIGLFATTVLLSICMSCYKCFMLRRRKAVAARTQLELEGVVGGHEIPNGNGPKFSETSTSSGNMSRTQVPRINRPPHPKTRHSNGKKYPAATSSVVRQAGSPGQSGQTEQLKRHSMYYSVESMASMASAIEDTVSWTLCELKLWFHHDGGFHCCSNVADEDREWLIIRENILSFVNMQTRKREMSWEKVNQKLQLNLPVKTQDVNGGNFSQVHKIFYSLHN